jgi:hypothetical protein
MMSVPDHSPPIAVEDHRNVKPMLSNNDTKKINKNEQNCISFLARLFLPLIDGFQ